MKIRYRPWQNNIRNIDIDGGFVGYEARGKGEVNTYGLQRCPNCRRENYAMAVSSGTCSWCGWDLNEFIKADKATKQKLTIKDIGKWVIYKPELENERGRIKSFNNKRQIAWVVYKCDGDWANYGDYTAAATKFEDLTIQG